MLQQAVDRQLVAQETPLELCVVIPTLNEAGNVELLLDKLGIALAGIEWEAIFVDDGSTDGTPEILTRIAQSDRRVRMIRRIGRRGLSSAVVEGALASTTPVIAVIDADLQHGLERRGELANLLRSIEWRQELDRIAQFLDIDP